MDGGVEADHDIPHEFYKAVAEIIHILYAKSPHEASVK
jgi:flagellar biosynthesis protein FlhB